MDNYLRLLDTVFTVYGLLSIFFIYCCILELVQMKLIQLAMFTSSTMHMFNLNKPHS
jgi:hypothetical protein